MNKAELRKYYLNQRKNFSEKEVEQMSDAILIHLKSMNIWNNSVFHLFKSIPNKNEINTLPIQNYLLAQNKTVVVPKVQGTEMINCAINSQTEWAIGKFNVPEPKFYKTLDNQLIDVVFLPMLIADKAGNRIGYGGGYYDRFLAKCTENTLKIGLNFFSPIEEIKDVEEFDIPLDYCVTAERIVSFSS